MDHQESSEKRAGSRRLEAAPPTRSRPLPLSLLLALTPPSQSPPSPAWLSSLHFTQHPSRRPGFQTHTYSVRVFSYGTGMKEPASQGGAN